MSGAVTAAPPPPAPQKLDELMLAMDVVDTIRHRELLVERELQQGARDDELRNRLREIYKGQGIDVPDSVIDEGIKALKDSRFVYVPPKPGVAVTLATMWVNRAHILWTLFSVVLFVVGLRVGYYLLVERPPIVAAETARIELSETLPKALDTSYANVLRDAKVDEARTQAAALLANGKAAIARRDADEARGQVTALDALDAKLLQTYELRIVSRPDEDTGIIRSPSDSDAENYYLIVEAIGADGRAMNMDIANEENERTYRRSMWGVRVSEEVFDRVRNDKNDDGIVENNILGQKLRGELQVRYNMPVLGGTITRW
ncbi:MAG: hypothetical protein GC190_10285 [Alphaproteobacteria bacterium]|nr:hypothetical protein [Alphaproteobacteria bacterium]